MNNPRFQVIAIAASVCVVWLLVACASQQTDSTVDINKQIAIEILTGDIGRAQPTQVQWSEIETQIGECMRSHGFEYYETPYESNHTADSFGLDLEDLEKLDTYGLGVSTLRYRQVELGNGLIGNDRPKNSQPTSDANDEYFNSLSSAGATLYLEVFEGDQGCEITAVNNVTPWLSVIDNLDFQAVNDVFAANASVIADNNRIERCLLENGEQFGSYGVAVAEFSSRLDNEVEPLLQYSETGRKFSEAALEALKQIQQEEVRLARVLSDCDALPFQRPDEIKQIARDTLSELLAN